MSDTTPHSKPIKLPKRFLRHADEDPRDRRPASAVAEVSAEGGGRGETGRPTGSQQKLSKGYLARIGSEPQAPAKSVEKQPRISASYLASGKEGLDKEIHRTIQKLERSEVSSRIKAEDQSIEREHRKQSMSWLLFGVLAATFVLLFVLHLSGLDIRLVPPAPPPRQMQGGLPSP